MVIMNEAQKKKQNEILRNAEEVIARGPYKADWDSLAEHPVPQWYRDAKFGIFIHWGVYSVPAFGSEWYPRNMYLQGSPEYEHHRKTYGNQKIFGYKDFIPMFRAEKFDAEKWLDLFEEAGARYIMPVAEHHDGFQMYASGLSEWNAAKKGPCRDVIGELKQAAEKRNIVFTVSDHRAEHCWFFSGGTKFDSDVRDPANADFYDDQTKCSCDLDSSQDILSSGAPEEHLKNWLARICEIVDKYHPKAIYFDWWIQNISFKPYLKKFAAFYYNRAAEWGQEVTIDYKFDAFPLRSAVFDVERGQMSSVNPLPWQTDTAIAENSWGYTDGNKFKNPVGIVEDLVDIVSKNGCLLLNVGPRSDGTFTEEDSHVLREIGRWMKINGEGIYGTKFWKVYGEGPTKVPDGSFTDTERTPYTSEDIRFTCKGATLYAFVMKYPENGKVTIRTLGRFTDFGSEVPVKDMCCINGSPLKFRKDENGMHIEGPKMKTDYPVCFRITLL